jgi:hypothetical protein
LSAKHTAGLAQGQAASTGSLKRIFRAAHRRRR